MIDKQGKTALLTVFTIVLLITAMMILVGCQKFSEEEDIPDLIEEIAVDVTEEILDEVVERNTGVDPEFDFNGNDKD